MQAESTQFAAIYLPDFFLQAVLRAEPELRSCPVILLDPQQPKAGVVQMTHTARQAGVVEGMTPPQAMARCASLHIRHRVPAEEQAATDALLQCAWAFSPVVEATAPGVCTLDLASLPGPLDATWAQGLIDQLARLHLQARVGMAATPDLALLAARCARPFLAVQDVEVFLANLPIESLEPGADLLRLLRKWGIRTAGQFCGLGKSQVAERLGPDGVALWERACAQRLRPLRRVQPPAVFEEAMEFEREVESLEPLLFVLGRFVGQLAQRLALAGLAAAQLELRLRLADGTQYQRLFNIPAPTTDPTVLLRMLQTHLETVRTPQPITALFLQVTPARPAGHQLGLFQPALRDPNQFHETLMRLTALLGADRVGTPVLEWSHRPDAFRLQVPRFDAAHTSSSSAGALPPGLSLRRFRPPIPATVQVRDGQPMFLCADRFNGPIVAARGPWRTSGQWWDPNCWQRDEWDVQTADGRLYRLSLQPTGWFLEGLYD
jgi:protein ImuB